MNNQDGAAKFLRHLAYQLASDELEPSSEVARLREIADDLEVVIGTTLPKGGQNAVLEAIQRLRRGAPE